MELLSLIKDGQGIGEWNGTSDVLSSLREAWQEEIRPIIQWRTHTCIWWRTLLLPSLTFYEYDLSGFCFLSFEVHYCVWTLCSYYWHPSSGCFLAERKSGDIMPPFYSSKMLRGFGMGITNAQMFNDVQPSDAKRFIILKLLKLSSLLAYLEDRTVKRHILSRSTLVFICISR